MFDYLLGKTPAALTSMSIYTSDYIICSIWQTVISRSVHVFVVFICVWTGNVPNIFSVWWSSIILSLLWLFYISGYKNSAFGILLQKNKALSPHSVLINEFPILYLHKCFYSLEINRKSSFLLRRKDKSLTELNYPFLWWFESRLIWLRYLT